MFVVVVVGFNFVLIIYAYTYKIPVYIYLYISISPHAYTCIQHLLDVQERMYKVYESPPEARSPGPVPGSNDKAFTESATF